MAEIKLEMDGQLTEEEAYTQQRRSYVGGSEVFELLNEPQYARGCHTALAYRKLGVEPDFEIELDDALMKRGNVLEPIAASIYEQMTGRKVRRPPMDEHGHAQTRRHPMYPWAAVATDRLILTGHGGVTEVGDLEIKTRDQGPYVRVLRQGPYKGDLLQPQWSMFVTGHRWASLAILGVFGTLPMTYIDSLRDEELMTIFQREGEKFSDTVWGKGELPDPVFPASDARCKVCPWRMTCRGQQIDQDELREVRDMARAARELVQISNADLSRTLNDLDLLKAEKKSIEVSIDMASQHALMMLADADAALVRGYGKVYKMASQANYLDSFALKAQEPDIYERFFVRRATGGSYLRTYPSNKGTKECQ